MAKSNNTTEKQKNIFANVIDVIKMVSQYESKLPLYLALGFALPFLIVLIIAIVLHHWFLIILAVLVGLVGFLIVLNKVSDKTVYNQIKDQPGGSSAILKSIKVAGSVFDEKPVFIDPKTYDMAFRGVTRAGIIFVTEGPIKRVKKPLEREIQKVRKTVANVAVHTIHVGTEQGQIPLKKLKLTVSKLKPVLTKQELEQVKKRMHALGTMKMPIPKGMDPSKTRGAVSRRALRGK